MPIDFKEQGNDCIAFLSGDIDLSNSGEVQNALLDVISKGKNVTVNMSNVGYIDSSCIASFVRAYQEAKKTGNSFALDSVPPKALRVLQLAKLDKVFKIK